MAYMIYQQLISAIDHSYRERSDASANAEMAAEFKSWLASLKIDPKLRDPLVEQAAAIEDGFRGAANSSI